MANFFDQYDTAEPSPAAASPPAAGKNFFDQFDAFDARYKGDMPAPPVTEELKVGLQAKQAPRERGKSQGREGGYLDAIPRAITTGLVGNLPDYPPAAIEGVKSAVRGEGFSKGYSDELEVQRGQREGLAEAFPKTTLGGILTGAVAPAFAAAKLITAPTLPGRMAQSAGVGGVLGGLQGAASGEGLEGRRDEALKGAALGAAIAPAGEAIVTGASKLLGKTLGAAREPAPGVVPAERIAAADEFAIPLTRGQATGNVGQQAYEEAARNYARGRPAGSMLSTFDAEQAKAIAAAKSSVSETLGGAPATLPDAGSAVATAVKQRAAGLREGAEEAYGRAAGKDASIAADEVANLGRSVAAKLESEGIRLDAYGNYTGSQAAMNLLRRVAGFEGAGEGKVVAESLQGLEQARKGILRVQPANAEDARGLQAIRRSFDDWITNAVDRKLFSGDATALEDLKQARALWAQYKGLTTAGKGDASPIVAKMATEERTGEEVANWLLGTAGAGQAGRSARVAADIQKALGPGSQEWEALRQAAWTKMSAPVRPGAAPQDVPTPSMASKAILDFTRGQGAPLSRVLFTADEIGKMNRLAVVLRTITTDKKAANPSKSGYEIARSIGGISMLGGGGAGYWWSGDPHYLAIAAAPLLRGGQSLSKGIAAVRAEPNWAATGLGTTSRAGVLATPGLIENRR